MRYYTDDARLNVHRIDEGGGTFETYCFPLGRWAQNLDLMDVLIGEAWVDEIAEDEADAIIARGNREIHSD